MPIIVLPDGTKKTFDGPVSVAQVAESIGPGLAKAALAGRFKGQMVDTSTVLSDDGELALVTDKDDAGLEVLRHSCAHILAQAVQRVYPAVQVTIGPVIDDGFYYDFACEHPFTPEDLTRFEQEMQRIIDDNLTIERHEMARDAAIEHFSSLGEKYKVQIIQDLPEDDALSLYQQGDFMDLCRGPHVPSTGKIKAFKLVKLAGAYWRGDSKNDMLQRIYGTCWANKKDLKAYLTRIEEAEKRDHRKLGKQLSLFHFQDIAPGMVFWHPAGWTLYQQIQQYLQQKLKAQGYQEVNTPQIVDSSLWEQSGHWDKFRENMFTVETENKTHAVKPMNCPCHVQIFNQGLKSYRDLPLRLAEFGSCHRNEASGALHGLMRVRHFVQDDGHIFCTEAQIQSEVGAFIDLLFEIYADFGFTDILVRLSTRPEERVGDDATWDKAEEALEQSLKSKGLEYGILPGEGAFYGPKLEFTLKDSLGRLWQCGTMQLDFSMPHRLGATYIAEDGNKQVPVMLHRAILGTFERFIGILIEETAGILPAWLAPTQVVIVGISEKHADYVQEIQEKLFKKGIRSITDLRNEKIGFKIREHTLKKVPFFVVVGDREKEDQMLTVRTRQGDNLGTMSFETFYAQLQQTISMKAGGYTFDIQSLRTR